MFIGGGLRCASPILLTSLVVVGLTFTFDSSLVVIGSLTVGWFLLMATQRKGGWWWWWSICGLLLHHALTSLLLVGLAFTLDPSSVVNSSNYEAGLAFIGGLTQQMAGGG